MMATDDEMPVESEAASLPPRARFRLDAGASPVRHRAIVRSLTMLRFIRPRDAISDAHFSA